MIFLELPEELDLVVEEEADEVVEDSSLDEAVKELLEVGVVAGIDEIDLGTVKAVEGELAVGKDASLDKLVVGKDVSSDKLVVVNAMIVEEIEADLSVEVLRPGTTVLVAIETSRVDISRVIEVLGIGTTMLVAIEAVRVDTSGVV